MLNTCNYCSQGSVKVAYLKKNMYINREWGKFTVYYQTYFETSDSTFYLISVLLSLFLENKLICSNSEDEKKRSKSY